LQRARLIEETLNSFGAPARVVEINRGPTITQFGVEPDYIESRGGRLRVRVSKITVLADDLALALAARTIRIQAPVPGKGFVGIEVPNEEISLVALRDVIESQAFKRLKSPLRFALGQNVSGHAIAADLAAMPHLLIAGATGSGKSVCVNALITCLLMHNTPNELRLLMVDPKRVELTGYNGIPHLLAPVVVELERVVTALQWVGREMDMRYHKLAEAGCRNVQDYNTRQQAVNAPKLPHLVVIIDELADLMMLAPDETERTITRLAQLARATGIHLVIATQRPSVDVVTGLIKANFPARIAFAVASGVDSRVILDQPGAERLLGSGDMLFQAPDAPAPVRLQGVFVSDSEIARLVSYWQSFSGLAQAAPSAAGGVVDALPAGIPLKQIPMWDELEQEESSDPLMSEAIDLVRRQGRASISMLQRRLRIGYTRAARLVESMEEKGIVGPPDPGTGAREVLDYGPAAPPVDEA
jgi:S-DNA-T family DNA segregation ATPase FtsK/SpoIIIE